MDYRNIPYVSVRECAVCGNPRTRVAVELPAFPVTEIFVREKPGEGLGRVDQELLFCENCSHAQLKNRIDSAFLYGETANYTQRTSQSPSSSAASDFFEDFVNRRLGGVKRRCCLEVGANDLYLAKKLRPCVDAYIAVDPVLKNVTMDIPEGVRIIPGFVEDVEFRDMPDLVICKDVLEHIHDPASVLRSLLAVADPGADFFISISLLETLSITGRFDQLSHQHIHSFSLHSLQVLLQGLGCHLVDYSINYMHFEAVAVQFRKGVGKNIPVSRPDYGDLVQSYAIYGQLMNSFRKRVRLLAKDTQVYGYGANAMLPVLFYFMNLDRDSIQSILDDTWDKNGLYYINCDQKIVHASLVDGIESSCLILTAIQAKTTARKMLTNDLSSTARHVLVPSAEW